MAKEGEAAVRDGKTRWEGVRKLQQVHAGRRSTRPNAVRKENGELTKGPINGGVAEVASALQQSAESTERV